ncbi:succinate dehydrogenase assembly factor 2, mitochondrial-like [Rhopilema esculentum]|uniref:succinate dehydrogenase assembly factor 2, mitochondrial-like n=1 Tax=Rhopilema esculentum TaxID=499914 RepID=UPI0031D2F01A
MNFRQCCKCLSSSQRRFTLDTVSSICRVQQWRYFQTVRPTFASNSGDRIIDFPDMGPTIPEYKKKENEDLQKKRARLFYQSRKRGMSENGLLLSTFATLQLHKLEERLLDQYDKLINKPSNDWEIFYWMTEKKPTPDEYNNEIMNMLKKHAKNEKMEMRHKQPDLDVKTTPMASKE